MRNRLGSDAGREIGLIFVLMGVVKMLISVLGYANPQIAQLERETPNTPETA